MDRPAAWDSAMNRAVEMRLSPGLNANNAQELRLRLRLCSPGPLQEACCASAPGNKEARRRGRGLSSRTVLSLQISTPGLRQLVSLWPVDRERSTAASHGALCSQSIISSQTQCELLYPPLLDLASRCFAGLESMPTSVAHEARTKQLSAKRVEGRPIDIDPTKPSFGPFPSC